MAATNDLVLVTDREFDDTTDALRCISAETGEERWVHRYPALGMLDYGNSPRATPLIAGDSCWLLGAHGNLSCVGLATGRERWQLDLKEFGLTEEMKWGLCGSPLLVDGKLVVYAGGPQAALVALDPASGKVLWKTPGRPPGYGSLIVATLGGQRQIVGHDATHLAGWDIATGQPLWSLAAPVTGDFNVPTPIVWQGQLVVATENNGTRLYAFGEDGRIQPEPVAAFAELAPDTHSPVVTADRLFGVHYELFCLDLKSGLKVLWRGADDSFHQHTSVIASPTRVLLVNDAAELLLLDATASEYRLLGRMKVLENESGLLSHPALVGSRLYLRGSSEVVCVLLD